MYYHVTPTRNVSSILKEGIRPSQSGLDGPGVYVWKGPLEEAVRNADISLSDNHYDLSAEEYNDFCKSLTLLEVTLGSREMPIAVQWEDYCVLTESIPPECVKEVGNFYDLAENVASKFKDMKLD